MDTCSPDDQNGWDAYLKSKEFIKIVKSNKTECSNGHSGAQAGGAGPIELATLITALASSVVSGYFLYAANNNFNVVNGLKCGNIDAIVKGITNVAGIEIKNFNGIDRCGNMDATILQHSAALSAATTAFAQASGTTFSLVTAHLYGITPLSAASAVA